MLHRREIVTCPARFKEIRPAWRRLWDRSNASVFQSHEWVEAWWNSLGERSGYRLRIGLDWEGDELVAILPFAVAKERGVRVLEWAAQAPSDYCDALLAPSLDAQTALGMLWTAIRRTGGFDLVRLRQIRSDARCRSLIDRMDEAQKAFRPSARHEISLQLRSQWNSGDAWFRSLNKKTRNNHLRGKRILAESGDVSVRQHQPGEPLLPVLERLVALKQQWLVATGRHSELLEDDAAAVAALVEALAATGQLKIFLVECGATIVAGSINVLQGDKMMAFMATYDPAYERASPGTILMVEYTMWAFDNGISEIDYLRGQEAYKFKFANAESALHTFFGTASIAGRAALGAYAAKISLQRRWASLKARGKQEAAANGPQQAAYGSAYITENGTARVAFKAS